MTPFPPQGMPQGMPQPQQPMQAPGPQQGMPAQQPMPPQMPAPQQQLSPDNSQDDDDDIDPSQYIDYALSEINLAKKLQSKKGKDTDSLLDEIGMAIYDGYMDDERSRSNWMKTNEEWLKLALLIREEKSFPWPKASNIKYPMIATAAMQFSARAYPALVPSDGQIVKAKPSGLDPDGTLADAAIRVSSHMSYQILCRIPNWEEDMDKLLMTMAVSGVCFKKTYHDSLLEQHCSHLVYPENLVINYYAKSLESAYRKTELLYYTDNEIKEKVNNDETFLDIDYGSPTATDADPQKKAMATELDQPKVDKSAPHCFLSCHTFWDLDNDGYEEPYIITIHRQTRKVVRIIARWDSDGVVKNGKKVVKITPVEYFTDFPFIPNPDGSVYACGFGMLLAPLNESVNTIINQLVDSGTLNNLAGGFVGKNLRIKMGQMALRPGEWKVVNATGEDLSKSFYPTPTKEPSTVLYQLLQMLVQSGNQLASIAEIFVGKMPGQNTPATTTQETIQQGMAVFTAIYKRVYRSLGKEFKKIFRLNRITPGILDEETKIIGTQIQKSDYDDTEHLIIPGADPSGDSSTVKMMKLEQVGKLLELGVINQMEFATRVLEANEVPNYQKLLQQPPPPPPDPKVQTEQIKQQTEQVKQQGIQQKTQSDAMLAQQKLDLEKQLAQLKIEMQQRELEAKQQEQAMDLQGKQAEHHMNQVAMANDMQQQAQQGQLEMAITQKQGEIAVNTAKKQADQQLEQGDAAHKQKLTQGEQTHKQKLKQTKETTKTNGKQK